MIAIPPQATLIIFILFFATAGALFLMGLFYNKFKSLILKSQKEIEEGIKFSVAPKFIELSLGVNDLVDLAIEIWRMDQRILESGSSLTENHSKGLNNSIERLKRYIEKYDIEIVDYTNQKFNDGWNLEILSVEKDPSIPHPIVKKTIEPTIICKGQVARRAKIILLTNN
ncbi:MAG: hypothetical protein KA052_00425 [Candidatus Pacebacteria bacterium]|nr:hypothetical protein [Candidatus Paceibacterota bacterium]